MRLINFNPRSPYGERLASSASWISPAYISIHAPLTGSDYAPAKSVGRNLNFNPRSPYGERQKSLSYRAYGDNFNPRSPYGERLEQNLKKQPQRDFNPRSPYGERRRLLDKKPWEKYFNPRSPYGERPETKKKEFAILAFQSTLPLRGATY